MDDTKKNIDDDNDIINTDGDDLALPPPRVDSFTQKDIRMDDVLKKQGAKAVDAKTLKQRKDYIKYGSIGAGCLIVLFFLFSGQTPKGPLEYGVCSVFLEMNTPYPHTLKYLGVEGSRTSIRIYYTSTDPFGQYKMEMLDCKFSTKKLEMTEALINRRPVPKELVQKFNRILPTLVQSDLYLDIPPHWKNPSIR